MRFYFKVLVVSSLESFPCTSEHEGFVVNWAIAHRKRERLAALFSRNCRDLIAKKAYSISNWHQKLKGNYLRQVLHLSQLYRRLHN